MGPSEVFSNECPKQDTTICKLLDVDLEGAGGIQLNFLGVVVVEMCCSVASSQEFLVPMFVMPVTLYKHIPAIIGTSVLDLLKEDPALTGALKDSVALLSRPRDRKRRTSTSTRVVK